MFEQLLGKTVYKICFLHKEYSTMNIIRTLTLKQMQESIKIGKSTYVIDFSTPIYCRKNEKIYFIDIENGNQLHFNSIESIINPNELDLLISNKLLKELVAGITDTTKEKVIYIILGVILGALGALVFAMGYYQDKINAMYESNQIIDFATLSIKIMKVFI